MNTNDMEDLASAENALFVYGDLVLRTAFTMVKNRSDAEDIAQDVFLTFVRKAPVFESAEHQKAWLLRVTINRSKSFLRSAWQRKTQGLEDAFPELSFSLPEIEVTQAVQELPLKYREVIYLYYIQGYRTPEIAKLLNRPQNTIVSRIARARAILRKALEESYKNV